MMVAGGLCAMIHGSAAPLMILVFGTMTDTFVAYELQVQELNDPNKMCSNNTIYWTNGSIYEVTENVTAACGWVRSLVLILVSTRFLSFWLVFYSLDRIDIEAQLTQFSYYYVAIGFTVMVTGYFQVFLFTNSTSASWVAVHIMAQNNVTRYLLK